MHIARVRFSEIASNTLLSSMPNKNHNSYAGLHNVLSWNPQPFLRLALTHWETNECLQLSSYVPLSIGSSYTQAMYFSRAHIIPPKPSTGNK